MPTTLLRSLMCFAWGLSFCACGAASPRAPVSEVSEQPPASARVDRPPALLDTEAICDAGQLEPSLERLCVTPLASDTEFCEQLESSGRVHGLQGTTQERPRLLMALASHRLERGRRFDEDHLHSAVMASYDTDAEGTCALRLRAGLESLHRSRCHAAIGVLRRPERGRFCAALRRSVCSLALREAESVRHYDLGRAGELFRALSNDRGCSPRAEQAWHYGVQASRAFDGARRFQDAQRVDEALMRRPRPLREVPHVPRWQRRRWR